MSHDNNCLQIDTVHSILTDECGLDHKECYNTTIVSVLKVIDSEVDVVYDTKVSMFTITDDR